MPVVTLDAERFSKFIGRSVKIEDIVEHIPWMGVDIEDIGEDSIKIEYNPNRPDLGIITGLAKAYQGLTRQEMGLKSYTTCEGEYRLVVEESVREVRPYVVSAVIKGVPMDEETLKEIILLQEDLHEGLGRQRKRVSIGIHSLDVVRFPVHYYARGGKEVRFIPLDEEREMSLTEILEKTEKGREYAHIFEGFDLYPLIVDNEGHVLSFPPIINSEYTRLSAEAQNLFFDVTATDLRTAEMVLNVLTTSIVDYGGEVWNVSVEGADYNFECPDFSVRENHVEVKEARRILGLNLSGEEVVECLRACRFDAEILDGGRIRVAIPPYRVDIMHPVDIVEEVAIGYGFWRIEPSFPKTFQIGRKHVKMDFLSTTTEILIGAGFQEVMNLTLSSLKEQFTWMELEAENYVSVKNPKSHEYEILRKWLIPDLLEVLRVSKKEQYPQRIFEVGIAVYRKGGEVREENHLGVALTHWEAGYSDAKSLLDVLHQILDVKTHVEPISHPSFLEGRAGRIRCGGRELGVMGEINPQVLENFQLDHPVVAMEINLDELYDIYLEKELQT
ncbi:MAG: phenylalanine--tRNA ligase subunit beta [Nitrososphaeria archaeon]|nr:phenylalanine--tRNA ligase subunit beta [Nitrososphaeria archaeon]NIN52675.1 phenylalanine--tRNA ligase subunit beta [Nitrososphaeria archaeon]NIQ33150.1 phenylalanine--tRNA ligase subunit beta [Nitrososphaeria archaeon]